MTIPTRLAASALVLWAAAAHAAGPDGDVAAGRSAFAACASCHAVGPTARHGFGPQLNGVFGRAAGTAPGYAYSAAMKNARLVWTPQTLSAFLKDPDGTVPGTKMRFSSFGFSDRRIANLSAYLATWPATK